MVNIAKNRASVNNHHRRSNNSSIQKKLQLSKVSLVILVFFVVRNFWSGGSDTVVLDGRRTDAGTTAAENRQTTADRTLEVSRNDEAPPASSTAMTAVDGYTADDVSTVSPNSQFQSASDDSTHQDDDDDDSSIGSVLDEKDRGMNDWLLQNVALSSVDSSTTGTSITSIADDSLSSPLLDDKDTMTATDGLDAVVDHQLNISLTTPTFAGNDTDTDSLVPNPVEQNQTESFEGNTIVNVTLAEEFSTTRNETDGLDEPSLSAVADANATASTVNTTIDNENETEVAKTENGTATSDEVESVDPNADDTPSPTTDGLANTTEATTATNDTTLLLENPPVAVDNVTASNTSAAIADDDTKKQSKDEPEEEKDEAKVDADTAVADSSDVQEGNEEKQGDQDDQDDKPDAGENRETQELADATVDEIALNTTESEAANADATESKTDKEEDKKPKKDKKKKDTPSVLPNVIIAYVISSCLSHGSHIHSLQRSSKGRNHFHCSVLELDTCGMLLGTDGDFTG